MVRQYRACVVDLLGLGIMCGVREHVCHCTLSTSHPDLVCFLFVPALYSTFIYLSPLFLWSVMIVECILWCRLVYIHAKKSDGILYTFVVVCR